NPPYSTRSRARLPLPPPLFFLMLRRPPTSPLFPYTTLFRSDLFRGLAAGATVAEDRPARSRRVDLGGGQPLVIAVVPRDATGLRSEEHTSELQSLTNLVCRLLLEKKNKQTLGSLPRAPPVLE